MSQHKYERGQTMHVVGAENYEGEVEIAALLYERCEAHNALRYGCVTPGDAHYAICEECLVPKTISRRLN